jgi:hypothetical protein
MVVMNKGRTVLAQVLDGIHQEEFNRCVNRYPMERKSKAISAYDHFAAMVFAQLAHRSSLRDVVICLSSQKCLAYHSGIRGKINRCNLAYVNEHRPSESFAQVAYFLMRKAKKLYSDQEKTLAIEGDLFAIDSSIIDLSMSIFPWAKWNKTQGAVKLNVLLDVESELPCFCTVTDAKMHDVKFLDNVIFNAFDFYVFDKGYQDFQQFYRIDQLKAWFVTRLKRNVKFRVLLSRKIDKSTGLRCDQTIRLKTKKGRANYPKNLRRIRYYDEATKKSLVFVTNNFNLNALLVAKIYKKRWEVELFFRWIKQHLQIRKFFSTSRNGVSTQIWTALCAYLLVAILKKKKNLPEDLYPILQIISIFPFSKVPINQIVMKNRTEILECHTPNQLEFKGF